MWSDVNRNVKYLSYTLNLHNYFPLFSPFKAVWDNKEYKCNIFLKMWGDERRSKILLHFETLSLFPPIIFLIKVENIFSKYHEFNKCLSFPRRSSWVYQWWLVHEWRGHHTLQRSHRSDDSGAAIPEWHLRWMRPSPGGLAHRPVWTRPRTRLHLCSGDHGTLFVTSVNGVA